VVAKLLPENGADVSAKTRHGDTPLHLAGPEEWRFYVPREEELVQLLLERGADVSAKADDGRTPLHAAAGSSYSGMVWILLDRGVDVSARTFQGETPLHAAVLTGDGDTGVTRNSGHAQPLGWSYAPRTSPTVGP